MAAANLITKFVSVTEGVTMTLDNEEAGMLLNVLNQHLAGEILRHGKLGDIRRALQLAKVQEIKLHNSAHDSSRAHSNLRHAVLDRPELDLCGND